MIIDVLIRTSDSFAISGQIIFWDLTNCSWGHLLDFQPKIVKESLLMIQYAIPARFKGLQVFNPPTGFETFAKLVLGCLSEKNRKRVTEFHYGKNFLK